MVKARTNDEIISMVRQGGGQAFTAMGHIMDAGKDYPGDINDVFGLLDDTEPVCFGHSPSHLAQAYLFNVGVLSRSDISDDWQTIGLLKSPAASSLSK